VTKAKQYSLGVQKADRHALLASRRVVFQGATQKDETAEKSQVQSHEHKVMISEVCKGLSKSSTREPSLRSLVKMLSDTDSLAEEFTKMGTALYQLAGILSGHTPLHQALAAQAVTNLAASSGSARLLKPIGPYLVAHLSSPVIILKDYCAWAIGNMAGDSPKCRRVLVSQGAVPPLCRALRNTDDQTVLYSTLFALRNLSYCQEEVVLSSMLDCGVVEGLQLTILDQTKCGGLSIMSEALWVVSHLVTCTETVLRMSRTQLLSAVCEVLCAASILSTVDVAVMTACVRIVGNSIGHLPELVTTLATDGKVEGKLEQCASQSNIEHLKKEASWVLSNIKYAKERLTQKVADV
jgi:hypothetical protein